MRLAVNATDVPALRLGIEIVGVRRIGKHPEPVAAEHVLPTVVGNTAGKLRITHPRTVVLQPAIDVVRHIHVHADMVELRDGKILGLPPTIAAVIRIPNPAVIARD